MLCSLTHTEAEPEPEDSFQGCPNKVYCCPEILLSEHVISRCLEIQVLVVCYPDEFKTKWEKSLGWMEIWVTFGGFRINS